MQLHVSQVECAGHGRCHAVNPDLFPLDDDGFSTLDVVDVPPGLEGDARLGVDACPSRVISLSDD